MYPLHLFIWLKYPFFNHLWRSSLSESNIRVDSMPTGEATTIKKQCARSTYLKVVWKRYHCACHCCQDWANYSQLQLREAPKGTWRYAGMGVFFFRDTGMARYFFAGIRDWIFCLAGMRKELLPRCRDEVKSFTGMPGRWIPPRGPIETRSSILTSVRLKG